MGRPSHPSALTGTGQGSARAWSRGRVHRSLRGGRGPTPPGQQGQAGRATAGPSREADPRVLGELGEGTKSKVRKAGGEGDEGRAGSLGVCPQEDPTKGNLTKRLPGDHTGAGYGAAAE